MTMVRARFALLVAVVTVACGRVRFDGTPDDAARDASTLPVLVQGAANIAQDATALSTSLASPPMPGRVLLFAGAARGGSLESPVGGATTWMRAGAATEHANVEIWYGVADGTTTISIGFGVPTTLSLWVGEWSGLDPLDTLDVAVSMSGTVTSPSAGSIMTTAPDELLLFAVATFVPNTYGVPSGGTWTELDTQSDGSMQTVWSAIASTPGTVAPVVTETSQNWDAVLAAFRTRSD